MTAQARGARTLKGSLVSVGDTGTPTVIAFQYNPVTVKRQLKPATAGGDPGDRSQAVRLLGPPQETVSLEIELESADADGSDVFATSTGLHPQLAQLELLSFPPSWRVAMDTTLLAAGTIEIAPTPAPRLLFVWGAERVQPVQITSFSISEEEFDPSLNPIRAVVSLEMRVLTYADVSVSNPDFHQYLAYQMWMESMARRAPAGNRVVIGANG